MSNSITTGSRFSPEEAVEILTECQLIEDSIKMLREKAQKDLDHHLTEALKPKLRLVDLGAADGPCAAI